MNNPLFNLILAQFREFLREPSVLFWGLAFPILLAGVLGLAFLNQPGNETNIVAVVNYHENDILSENQLSQMEDTTQFDFQYLEREEAMQKIRTGELNLIVEFINQKLRFLYDPTNSEAKTTYLSLQNLIFSRNEQIESYDTAFITTQGNRYIDFLIPGLIAMGIMNSCLWGIGWNLIDLRIKKLLRRMIATPMRKSTFLFAQIISRAGLVLIEAVAIFLFANVFFNVTISGGLLAFIIVFLSGTFAFSGLAILVSSRARHSQVGNGIINAVTLPLIILSGIFFSIENFPEWAISIIRYLPLTLLADALRAVFNQEATIISVISESLFLILFGFIFLLAGIRIYKWY